MSEILSAAELVKQVEEHQEKLTIQRKEYAQTLATNYVNMMLRQKTTTLKVVLSAHDGTTILPFIREILTDLGYSVVISNDRIIKNSNYEVKISAEEKDK